MRLASLLLLMASAAVAQTFTNVSFTSSYGCIEAYYTTAVSGTVTLDYGTTTALGLGFDRNGMPSATAVKHKAVCGLTPSTAYYVRLSISGGTTWDCNVSAPLSGATCHAGTGYGIVSTTALPAGFGTDSEITLPDLSSVPTAPPAVTSGKTWNVTAGSVSSLKTQMAACAAGVTSGQVGEVVVPLGKYRDTAAIAAPNVPSGALCILRAPDLTKLPPDEVRTGPQWLPNMPVIESPIEIHGQWDSTLSSSLYFRNASNWYILGIRFQLPDLTTETFTEYTITGDGGVTNGTTLAVSPTPRAEIRTHSIVQVKGVNGTWTQPPGGPATVSGVSGNNVSFDYGAIPSGSWTSGGKMRVALAEAICDASNTTPIVITTCREHYFDQKKAHTISNASGSTLTIPANHGIPNGANYAVLVAGSSVTAYNGVWLITGSGSTSVTLSGGPASSCAASCGTVQWLLPIMVHGVGGNTAANRVSYYTTPSSTTVALYDYTGPLAGNGAYTSGGIIAQEPVHWPNMVTVENGSNNVHFDRCYWKGGFPSRVSLALAHSGGDSAIINNYFDDIQAPTLHWPGANSWAFLYTMNGKGNLSMAQLRTVTAIDYTDGANKRIENNFLGAHGITLFTQDPTSNTTDPLPANLLIKRNTFYVGFDKQMGSSTSDGIYYPHRHHWEMKRGEKALVEGNVFTGGWIDFNACGPVTMITPVKGENYTRDLWFRYNTFQGITEGFFSNGIASPNPDFLNPLSRRIWFTDNLFRDMDGSRIAIVRSPATTPQNCARPFRFEFGLESLHIEHNTIEMPSSGTNTAPFKFSDSFFSGVFIRNNITYQSGPDSTASYAQPAMPEVCDWCFGATTNVTAEGNPPKTIFDRAFGPNSTLGYNVVVPGVRNGPYSGTTSGYPSGQTRTRGECAVSEPRITASGGALWANFKGINCLGAVAGGDSADQRKLAPKWINPALNGNYRLRHDSPALASVDRSVTITGFNTSGVATVAAGHGYQVGYSATISGSSVSGMNTTATVTAIGSTTITLGSLTGLTCSSPSVCGTMRSPDSAVTNDGRDPGADMDALEAAQGKVRNTRSLVTGTTTAKVAYTAPDTAACTVEYGTSSTWGTGTRTSDGGGVPYRVVNLTGLSSGTTYHYRVLCAVEQPSGSFTTR